MQSDLAYRQNWMCDSTRMTNSSVGKEWPFGRNHSFPHLIIEVFEANNRVTADGLFDFCRVSVTKHWRASMKNCIYQQGGVLKTLLGRRHWYNYTYHDTRQPYSLYICICRKKIGRDSPPCVHISCIIISPES